MNELTFDKLPTAVSQILTEMREIKQMLLDQSVTDSNNDSDRFLSVGEAAEFLNLSVPTIYCKVSKGELPHMKRGKRLYFSHSELKDYIVSGKQRTAQEIEEEALTYLRKSK